MCRGCWDEYIEDSDVPGVPAPITPEITAAVGAIRAVYAEEFAGGAMHVAIDDWNLDDESVAYCGSGDGPTVMSPTARTCWELLTSLTEAQRATALAIYYRFHEEQVGT